MTLLLTRSDVERGLVVPEVLELLRDGFRSTADVEPLRVRTDLPGPGTATSLLPGLIPGIPAYTVKVNAKFPGATPALRGVVCLHDLTDGTLLALLDSASVTAWRTGLAAALATDVLAPDHSTTVGVIGAGAQATMSLAGLSHLRRVDHLVVYDVAPQRSARFLAEHDLPGTVATSSKEVAATADIVILATWSREPLLTAADLRPGLHLTTLGADEPGKIELGADLLSAARVVVDDPSLAVKMGAVGNVGLTSDAVHTTLSDVLTGAASGRSTPDEITVYAPVGLPWQDLALAWPAYRSAGPSTPTVNFLS